MKVLVLVNDAGAVHPTQTTASLAALLSARGHEVALVGVGDLFVSSQHEVRAKAAGGWVDVLGVDLLLLRTNLARDLGRRAHHAVAMSVARLARGAGVVVLNDPDGIVRASNKLYVATVPVPFRPDTVVAADPQALLDFIARTPGRTVLKPLDGTHGRDVFLVDRDHAANTRQMIDVLLRDGYAVAQAFVETDRPGDTRVIVLDGKLLEADGAAAVVRRVPGGSDFRSNVHAGGAPAAGVLTPAMRAAVDAVGPQLRADGLFLTGLDFVGDQIVEINVSAVGGLADAERFSGAPLSAMVVDALEARALRGAQDTG